MPHEVPAPEPASTPEATVDRLMDDLCADPERLAATPSPALPGFSPEPVRQARDLVVELLRGAVVTEIGELNLPDTAPASTASVPPPTPDAPTALRYAPYDARPPGAEHPWGSPPFEPTDVPGDTGPGDEAATDGPAYRAARTAPRRAWGDAPVHAPSGRSLPLANAPAATVLGAAVLLFGAEGGPCNPHGPTERVPRAERRGALLGEAAFLAGYAAAHRPGGTA